MKKILLKIFKIIFQILLSLLIACITFRIYNKSTDWKFFIAFMGGGIDACIISQIKNKGLC